MELSRRPVFVVSAPSGAGKTSIIKQSLALESNLVLSVSHTTRLPRSNEINGVDYFFVSKAEFVRMIKNEGFLEWAEVHGNFYGTSKQFVNKIINEGRTLLLDIDVQGAFQIKKLANLEAVFIFIAPPSIEDLKNRLLARGTENNESFQKRIANATKELQYQNKYDYIITNDILERAVNEFLNIIHTEVNNRNSSA